MKKTFLTTLSLMTIAAPTLALSATKTVTIDWNMSDPTNITRYEMYYSNNSDMADKILACETNDPSALTLTCSNVNIESYPIYFTILAVKTDGEVASATKSVDLTVSTVQNFMILSPGGDAPPIEGCSTNITDNFSSDLSKWASLDGSMFTIDTVNNELDFPTDGAGAAVYTNEKTCTINQWAAVEYNVVQGNAWDGIYLRSTNSSQEVAYSVRGNPNESSEIVWRYCYGKTCTTIATVNTGSPITINDSLGVEIEGTGNDTVVRVWHWPDQTIPARGNWGASTHTFTDNPPNPADNGQYVGIYTGNPSSSSVNIFQAGHLSP
jgi:hypothetical protein